MKYNKSDKSERSFKSMGENTWRKELRMGNKINKKEQTGKKEAVYKAAIKVIAREGFHDATIDKIATVAGVSVGTIYNYFQNKDDILNFIFQTEYEKRKSYFLEIQKIDRHPLINLKMILTMHFAEVKENPDIYRIILRERCMPRICHFEGITRFEGLPRFIEEILADGIRKEKIRSCNLKVVSAAVFGAIEALMSRYLLELEAIGHSDVLENASEEIINLLWYGLSMED